MLDNYKKLMKKWNQRGRLSQKERVQLPIYFGAWLGFLAVTAEGFKKLAICKLIQSQRPVAFAELVPRADKLGSLLKKHDDALRRFRNTVFHLREDTKDIERFFYERPERLEWAEELQAALDEFFSNYRILCQAQYALDGRQDEFFK